jgi:hypothetical protein
MPARLVDRYRDLGSLLLEPRASCVRDDLIRGVQRDHPQLLGPISASSQTRRVLEA